MDSWRHYSSWRSCPPDRPGEHETLIILWPAESLFLCESLWFIDLMRPQCFPWYKCSSILWIFIYLQLIIWCSTFNSSSIIFFTIPGFISKCILPSLAWHNRWPYLVCPGLWLPIACCNLFHVLIGPVHPGFASQGRCSRQTWESGAGTISLPLNHFFHDDDSATHTSLIEKSTTLFFWMFSDAGRAGEDTGRFPDWQQTKPLQAAEDARRLPEAGQHLHWGSAQH